MAFRVTRTYANGDVNARSTSLHVRGKDHIQEHYSVILLMNYALSINKTVGVRHSIPLAPLTSHAVSRDYLPTGNRASRVSGKGLQRE